MNAPPPLPEDIGKADRVRSNIYAGYARTAQATIRVAKGLEENEQVKKAAAGVFAKLGSFAGKFRTAVDSGAEEQVPGRIVAQDVRRGAADSLELQPGQLLTAAPASEGRSEG